MTNKKVQEDYYQEIVEKVLGTGSSYDFVNFLCLCVGKEPKDEMERLARIEFVCNWEDEFLKDIIKAENK